MTVIRFGNNKYTGTDIDTKPTNVPAGSEFFTDTGNIWIHDGADWELLIAPSTYSTESGGAVTIDDLTDVDTATVAPANNDVLTWNSTDSEWVPAEPPGASGGEANTSSNVGTGEGTLVKTKVGVDLPLKTLKQGTNITLTNNADDVTIASTGGGSITTISDAEDVTFTSLTNGDVMEYNSGTLDWENVVHDHSAEFAALAHDHDADYSAITHDHDADYADIVHDHDADYSAITHDHDADYSALGHVHSYASITDKPTEFTPEAHVHSGADITSGTVPIAQLPVATDTSKGISELATSGEVTAGLVVQASDTRLSDARTPTTHVHSGADITSGTVGPTTGGTGKSTYTIHSLLKGGTSNAYTEIPVGTTDQVLAVVSGTPAWKTLNNETVGFSQATGGSTVYEITHGMGATPTYVFIDCLSHSTGRTWTMDATKITVTFDSAVAGGANAVKIMWRAIL